MSIRSRRGIVLLEAIVALLVIGLTSAAALELFGAHLRAARRASALVTAVALAQDRLTAIRLSDAERLHPPSRLAGARASTLHRSTRIGGVSARSAREMKR